MLRAFRQVQGINLNYITPWTQERGGILSYGSASGITIVEYRANPSGAIPVGIQYNDVENMNLVRQPPQWRLRETDMPLATVGVAMEGEFEIDWLHLIGVLSQGSPAYVGPSGTITNSSSFGSYRIGTFLSTLSSKPHTVVYRGMGFSYQYMDTNTKTLAFENNPADRILIASPGFAKVRIDQTQIMRSQAGN